MSWRKPKHELRRRGKDEGWKGKRGEGDGDPWSNFEPSRSIYFSLAAEYQWSAASCIRHKRNRATKRRVIRYSCRCSSRRDRPRLNPDNTRSYRWRKISRFLMLFQWWIKYGKFIYICLIMRYLRNYSRFFRYFFRVFNKLIIIFIIITHIVLIYLCFLS